MGGGSEGRVRSTDPTFKTKIFVFAVKYYINPIISENLTSLKI